MKTKTVSDRVEVVENFFIVGKPKTVPELEPLEKRLLSLWADLSDPETPWLNLFVEPDGSYIMTGWWWDGTEDRVLHEKRTGNIHDMDK